MKKKRLGSASIAVAIALSKKRATEVARECAHSRKWIWRKITGRSALTFGDLTLIAAATGIELKWLERHCHKLVRKKVRP